MEGSLELALKDLKRHISVLIARHSAIRELQPAGHTMVINVSVRFVPIANAINLHLKVEREGEVTFEKSSELFTDGHFEALLELPLSVLDRSFIEFCRKRNNSVRVYEIEDAHFSPKSQQASINRMCKLYGLRVRFLAIGNGRDCTWQNREHQFFVMREKEPAARK